MDLSTLLKLFTVSGVSVGFWLIGLNRHIPPGWRGFAFSLSSLSALTFLAEASRLNRLAPWEESARELQQELMVQDMAYQHIAQQEALRRSHFPDPWGQPPAAVQPRPPRHIPPDVEVEVTAEPVPETKPIATLPASTLTPFDWSVLTDRDGCPCVAIVGNPGSGKSVLTTYLITKYFPGSTVAVYDTDCKPDEWRGLRVVGRRGNWEAIEEAMVDDLALLRKRTQLRGEGQDVGGEEVRVVEEFPTLAADLEPSDRRQANTATEWLKRITRRGRKYKFKVFLVSQSWSVRGLQIEGEGDLRKAFTVIFLGSYAHDALKTCEPNLQRREAIRYWLQQQQRPAIALHQGQVYPAIIPDFPPEQTPGVAVNYSDFGDPKNHVQKPVQNLNGWVQHPELERLSSDDVERLNRLFELSPNGSERNRSDSLNPRSGHQTHDAELLNQIVQMRLRGMGKAAIIEAIWGAKKGGNKAYLQAEQTYNRLTGES